MARLRARSELIVKPSSKAFGLEDGPPDRENEIPALPWRIHNAFCEDGCGWHALPLSDPRLSILDPYHMQDALIEMFRIGAIDLDDEPNILKIMASDASLISCDGTLYPAYSFVYRTAVDREFTNRQQYAWELLLQVLFLYNKTCKAFNEGAGRHVRGYFGGELVQKGEEQAGLLDPYDEGWPLLNNMTIVDAPAAP